MTYKYACVRKDMYEKKPLSILNSYRSFDKMRRLFKPQYWIIIVALFIAMISLVILAIFDSQGPFIWIPIITVIILLILIQILGDSVIYNDSVRKEELLIIQQNYGEYVSTVHEVLRKWDVDKPEKRIKLKAECEGALNKYKDKYAKVSNRMFEMFIGIPLGALIASIIYTNTSAIPSAILALIIIGLIVLGCMEVTRLFSYYFDGIFKDKYLLDVINELDYQD